MSDHDDIRRVVSESYAQAVTQPGGGCCGGGDRPRDTLATLAGYSPDQLDVLPTLAVENAFGCGNPLAFAEVSEGETVLDLGSGAGIDILLAGRKVGPNGQVIGIDMTDEMVDRARENIAASGIANVEVRKGLIEKLPVESGSVDWVISNCVINLSPDKPAVFAEIARVLKPGGRLLISDVVAQDLPDWVKDSESLYCSCVAGAISEDEYLAGLRDVGLEDVEVRERQVYDGSQLASFVQSDVPGTGEVLSCCGADVDDENVRALAETFVGKVWSARFFARKP